MRWFRLHSRLSSGLAIFSLALQLALSFGHIHLKESLGAAELATTAVATTVAAASAVVAPSDESQTVPAGSGPADHEHEYCAIYAINALVGSAQIAEPPALPLPSFSGNARHSIGCASRLAETRQGLARARAPPIV